MCHVTKSCDHLDENDWEELDKMAPHKNAPLQKLHLSEKILKPSVKKRHHFKTASFF